MWSGVGHGRYYSVGWSLSSCTHLESLIRDVLIKVVMVGFKYLLATAWNCLSIEPQLSNCTYLAGLGAHPWGIALTALVSVGGATPK